MFFEVEVQLQDASVKRAPETMALRHLPLPVNDGECDVLVGWACVETDSQRVRGAILLQVELRSCGLVGEVWIKDVELVSLNDLWWRVICIKVSLIVFVPLKAHLDTVKEARLAHHIECVEFSVCLLAELCFVCLHYICELFFIRAETFLLDLLEHR